MGAPQFLKTPNGESLVVLSERDYDALLARAGDEAAENRMAALMNAEVHAAIARGDDVFLPSAVWEAIEGGANPIRTLRKFRGLTQAQLAASAQTPQSYISQLESGARKGTAEMLSAIAKALGVPLSVLVG